MSLPSSGGGKDMTRLTLTKIFRSLIVELNWPRKDFLRLPRRRVKSVFSLFLSLYRKKIHSLVNANDYGKKVKKSERDREKKREMMMMTIKCQGHLGVQGN